jgi:hypothetical protein
LVGIERISLPRKVAERENKSELSAKVRKLWRKTAKKYYFVVCSSRGNILERRNSVHESGSCFECSRRAGKSYNGSDASFTPAALRKAPNISFGRVNNRGTARCRRPVARYPTIAYVDRAASTQRTDGRCQILLTWR